MGKLRLPYYNRWGGLLPPIPRTGKSSGKTPVFLPSIAWMPPNSENSSIAGWSANGKSPLPCAGHSHGVRRAVEPSRASVSMRYRVVADSYAPILLNSGAS